MKKFINGLFLIAICGMVGCNLPKDSISSSMEVTDEVEESSTEEVIPRVITPIEHVTAFDTEEFVVKVTGVGVSIPVEGKRYHKDYIVELYYENKVENPNYHIYVDGIINGIQCRPYEGFSANDLKEDVIASGNTTIIEENKSAYKYVYFDQEELEESGVAAHYGYDSFTNIDLTFIVKYTDDREPVESTIAIYPEGKELAERYCYEPKSTDEIVLENEEVMIAVVGYDSQVYLNDTARLLIQNKTDKYMLVEVREAFVNGVRQNPYIGLNHEVKLQANSYIYNTISLFTPEFLTENKIYNIGKMELFLQAYPSNFSGSKDGEYTLENIVTLNPNGTEDDELFEREPKNTDNVLVDNEYINILVTGYEDLRNGIYGGETVPGDCVNLYITNKTEKLLVLDFVTSSANGIMMDIQAQGEYNEIVLLPQNSAFQTVYWYGDFINQITQGTMKEIQEGKLVLELYEYYNPEKILISEVVTVYPVDVEEPKPFVREDKDTDEILLNNEAIRLMLTGCEEVSNISNGKINLYVENKLEEEIRVVIEECVANGIAVEDLEMTLFAEHCTFNSIYAFGELKEYNMTEVETLEFSVKVYKGEEIITTKQIIVEF